MLFAGNENFSRGRGPRGPKGKLEINVELFYSQRRYTNTTGQVLPQTCWSKDHDDVEEDDDDDDDHDDDDDDDDGSDGKKKHEMVWMMVMMIMTPRRMNMKNEG